MANIQSQFEEFNNIIRLRRYDENEILREKRDIIRKKLKERLPEVFAAHNETCPTFSFLDQGSYAMNTGIKPLDGDFDIDQGLYFEISIDAYPDPVILKERVHEALDGHTDDVCIRRSCVTVFYHCDGEPIYHVDIAVYSDGECNADGKSYTAKGKQYSAAEHRFWKVSDPQQLTIVLFAKFSEADRPQFRRSQPRESHGVLSTSDARPCHAARANHYDDGGTCCFLRFAISTLPKKVRR